jgi:hypothetical protein
MGAAHPTHRPLLDLILEFQCSDQQPVSPLLHGYRCDPQCFLALNLKMLLLLLRSMPSRQSSAACMHAMSVGDLVLRRRSHLVLSLPLGLHHEHHRFILVTGLQR